MVNGESKALMHLQLIQTGESAEFTVFNIFIVTSEPYVTEKSLLCVKAHPMKMAKWQQMVVLLDS